MGEPLLVNTSPPGLQVMESTLVQQAIRSLRGINTHTFGDVNRGFREGAQLLTEARKSLVGALADNRVEEHELLDTRLIVLKAIAALHPFTPKAGGRSDRLLKVVGALKGVADCFIEHELWVQPPASEDPAFSSSSPRAVVFAEFSLEVFDAKLEQLLATVEDLFGGERPGADPDREQGGAGEASPDEENPFAPAMGYLEAIQRYAIPGCLYGTQARRENPYLAARALRAGCTRLQSLLLSRHALQEPLERLAKLEGRLTSFIEEVREAGAPFEEPEGWLRRFKASRLDALRSMCQELMDIEQTLRDQGPEREP